MPAARPDDVEPVRPRRPNLVEIAAAILIIGAAMDVVLSVEGFASLLPGTAETRFAAGLSVAIGLALVILGFLIRRGRAWLVTINVVAVAAFLEFAAATAQGVILAALDIFVVAALLRERSWFAWTPPVVEAEVPGSERPPLGRWGGG